MFFMFSQGQTILRFLESLCIDLFVCFIGFLKEKMLLGSKDLKVDAIL